MTLERRVPIKRGKGLNRGTSQLKRTRIKPMSDKRRAGTADRAAVRAAVFDRDRHTCRLYAHQAEAGRCRGPLTPHHLLKASGGGGFTLDNLVALCAGHNTWVEDNPALATELGMVIRAR